MNPSQIASRIEQMEPLIGFIIQKVWQGNQGSNESINDLAAMGMAIMATSALLASETPDFKSMFGNDLSELAKVARAVVGEELIKNMKDMKR